MAPDVRHDEAGDGMVVVTLSQVPVELREQAALMAAKAWGLTGAAYLELVLIARAGRPDCVLEVPARKYDLVMRKGKLPPGKIPAF